MTVIAERLGEETGKYAIRRLYPWNGRILLECVCPLINWDVPYAPQIAGGFYIVHGLGDLIFLRCQFSPNEMEATPLFKVRVGNTGRLCISSLQISQLSNQMILNSRNEMFFIRRLKKKSYIIYRHKKVQK